MLQQRNFPTLLTRLTPAPKLWFALGLTLAIILVKNLWFGVLLSFQIRHYFLLAVQK